ncbi:DEAD/DEAH box helicase family protein [Rhodanobacter denitrificans]|uniref:RecG-like helicase n=1 Tax=Rhodanobacter denitrificans TaxID=666685 RepID=M4NE37_9GAMM|nr:DEAD/DEAH box helicase family protein [Rhodanobacter denitrificans]AGG89035.1 RecG-like helicase [Rhodanobacter denitrificans]UJJ53062.1 DEAD/DEAH box helicase family protein [Rhodanobacter denitrificans]
MNASVSPSAATSTSPPQAAEALGRLVEVGLTEPWHVAFLLPESFADFRNVQDDAFGFDVGISVVLEGQVRRTPESHFGSGSPRTTVPIALADGTVVTLTWFGDAREVAATLTPGRLVAVQGQLSQFNGHWQISGPTLVERRWRDRCRPNYGGLGKRMRSDTLRDRVVSLLRDHLPDAEHRCGSLLQGLATVPEMLAAIRVPAGVDGFARLIVRAHFPHDPITGRLAIEAMERFAALVTLKQLVDSHEREARPRRAMALAPDARLTQWKFTPSPSQRAAVAKLAAVFSRGTVSTAFLSGDTGTGKSLTYLTIAAAVIDQRGRVAVLVPNEVLARQVVDVAGSVFTDLSVALVTGEANAPARDAALVVGTTAMLNRDVGVFDLVICDEQQKLGAAQRRQLASGEAHQLEVTATAIPRTMALAKFGLIDTVHLREGHTRKRISTKLWEKDAMRGLFQGVRETIDRGGRVLVVYPAISSKGGGELRSIEAARDKWEQAFPGQVRVLTGRTKGTLVASHISDLRDGTARIGICTSVIEVGIDIPDMRRVVVVHPERFGLTTLHQFRGRLAREGGVGNFDMLLMKPASDDVRERLGVMVRTNDGYELAEADLRLRGPGEMKAGGKKQSGGALSILFGREINPDYIEEMEPVLRSWLQRRTASTRKDDSA